jgi:hypothetical protein
VVRRQAIFSSERELQVKLASSIAPLVDATYETRVRREMPVGRCIPDLLAVSFEPTSAGNLWPSTWSYRHACIVAALRRASPLRLTTLAAHVYETEESAAMFIGHLLRSGAIRETSAGALYLSPEMRNLRTQVVAVEAKLARWSEALEQAVSYRAFADRVIVAMDAGLFDSTDMHLVGQFRRRGVGLCVVDQTGLRSIHSGRREIRASPEREYVSSSVFLNRTQTAWIRR